MVYSHTKCPRCGTFPEDHIDSETKRIIDPPPYEVESVRCEGCVMLDEERELIEHSGGGPGAMKGLYLFLVESRTEDGS